MTQQERDLEMAQMLRELRAAREELTILKERGRRYAARLKEVATVAADPSLAVFENEMHPEGLSHPVLLSSAEVPTLGEVKELVEETRRLRSTVARLVPALQSFGISNP